MVVIITAVSGCGRALLAVTAEGGGHSPGSLPACAAAVRTARGTWGVARRSRSSTAASWRTCRTAGNRHVTSRQGCGAMVTCRSGWWWGGWGWDTLTHSVHTPVRTHAHTHTHVCTPTSTHVRVHTHTHTNTHTHTHTHARTHAHTHTHARTHARTRTHAHTHTRTRTSAQARTHTHTRTHAGSEETYVFWSQSLGLFRR